MEDALEQNKVEIAKKLLKYNIDHLSLVCMYGKLELVNIILDNNINIINEYDKIQLTPLIQSCIENHYEIVEFLIEKGANVDLKGRDGMNALMIASHRGYLDIVKLLIYKKSDVNLKNNAGYTSLMFALENNNQEMIYELLKNGVDYNDLSKKQKNECEKILMEHKLIKGGKH
jgi:ankyrin repeat protein